MTAFDKLTELGYTVEVAFGDAKVERERRAELGQRVGHDALARAAEEIARDVAVHLRAQGRKDEEIIEVVASASAAALDDLKTASADELEQADRAIEEAEKMPTVYHVAGFGVDLYVSAGDKAALASLVDPDAHAERRRQFEKDEE